MCNKRLSFRGHNQKWRPALILQVMFHFQASRKWLESLYPSSDKRQRTADHVSKRPRGMTDAEVEKKIREVVVARFYSLAKVNWIYPSYLVSSQYRTFRAKSFLLHGQASVTRIMLPSKSLTRQFPVFTCYGNLDLQDINLVPMWYAIWCLVEQTQLFLPLIQAIKFLLLSKSKPGVQQQEQHLYFIPLQYLHNTDWRLKIRAF